MKNDLRTRIDKYYKLNTHLVYLDNERLNSLFEGERNTRGWGENHIIKLGKSKVFVKRIPLTDLEYKHMFSTRNLYDLPTYYNYGVGSAGFLGFFRELLNNILTDGNKPYLTDFGLALDRRFDLSETERAFFRKNTHYDYGEYLLCLGEHLSSIYQELAETKQKKITQKYGLKTEMQHHECFMVLLENIDKIYAEGLMKLDRSYVEIVIKYRDIIVLMAKFFADMARNDRKDTKYSHAKLKRLLEATEIIQRKNA